MWRFWLRIVGRLPGIVLESAKHVRGMLGSIGVLATAGLFCVEQFGGTLGDAVTKFTRVPSSVPAALLILVFIYLFMRVVYREYSDLERRLSTQCATLQTELATSAADRIGLIEETEQLRGQLAERHHRRIAKETIAYLLRDGDHLRRTMPSHDQLPTWIGACQKWFRDCDERVRSTLGDAESTSLSVYRGNYLIYNVKINDAHNDMLL